jgi:hypothetical protein
MFKTRVLRRILVFEPMNGGITAEAEENCVMRSSIIYNLHSVLLGPVWLRQFSV